MISIYDIDSLIHWASANRIGESNLKRFRTAMFKKALPLESCLEELPDDKKGLFLESIALPTLTLANRNDSGKDGATKLAFRTRDGHLIETVILRIASGRTSLCVSSQAGCAANCAFCATGKLGLARNLTSDEMLDQVLLAMQLVRGENRRIRNVVFMGMGEPLHNEKHLYRALDTLRDARAFYLADRHLMVSTVGMAEAMARFATRYPDIRLALSLHSARQELRKTLMPAGKSQTLEKLRAKFPTIGSACPIMIEYVLLKGVNDGEEDLSSLINYLKDFEVRINLIQFNPHPGSAFNPVTKEAREQFAAGLRRAGFKVTLRHSLGDDIAAACGQLAGKS